MSGVADGIWAVLIGVVMLAVLFVLVRPGSVAGTAVTDVSNALASLIGTATGNFGGSANS